MKKKDGDNTTKNEVIAGLKGKLAALEMEIKTDISIPVVASFGFIIALVWRDAIKGAIDEFLSRSGLLEQAYLYNFISAIIITIIVIIIMIIVTRLSHVKKTKTLKKRIEIISKELKK